MSDGRGDPSSDAVHTDPRALATIAAPPAVRTRELRNKGLQVSDAWCRPPCRFCRAGPG